MSNPYPEAHYHPNARLSDDYAPIEPLPSTLDTIAAIRKQNEVWRLEAEREEIRAALDVAKAEMQTERTERMERFEIIEFNYQCALDAIPFRDWHIVSDESAREFAQARLFATGILAAQIVAHL